MISEFESNVIDTIINFYNYNFEPFFEYLDEGVLWYGPKEHQFIAGKDNLINSLKNINRDIKFGIDKITTKLIPFSSAGHTLIVSYSLKLFYPDNSYKTYLQRVIIVGHKHRDKDGKIFWRCPMISVSNIMPDNQKDVFISEKGSTETPTERNRHLVLPGDNHSTVYIRSDSVKYISGGKGVMCYVHTDEGDYLIRKLLKDVLPLLPDNFYRCHSSYIVNKDRILYLSSQKIILKDKSEIPISVKRFSEIKAELNNWMDNN